jgi:bifunctional ADP-heptose synthase (sugar kinase/adenylyltransferase)
LDTRNKIILRQDIPPGQYRYVSGWFDPLVAAHLRRLLVLRESGPRLVVVIHDPDRPILPARARAELLAALDCVDYVVIGGAADVSLDSEHQAVYDDLVRYVAQRHHT